MLSKRTQSVAALSARAYRLLALMLFLRPFGNLSLAWGMRHFTSVLALNPFLYVRALFNPYVALGVGALIFALVTRMALLSLADLSVVLPLTASGYIVSTLLGKFFLGEEINLYRWLGTILIFAGALMVGWSSRKSNRDESSLLPAEH
jgi:drug/metabolite transporter (DMT)-like permease